MSMKIVRVKPFFVLFALWFLLVPVSAQGVNTSELQSVVKNPDSITFYNYTGPHTVISTAAQIRGIGSEIAVPITGDSGTAKKTGQEDRYTVLHIVDSAETAKLDADILILGINAGVDHIKNLRRIIAGFLTQAYGYSTEDSDTLAVFITVYNAVNRGRLDTFREKYKNAVIEKLTAASCGLSVHWEDWAGNTQIVIPLLSPVDGGLSTIDTTVISSKEVIDNLRSGDDRGVEDRKNLVNLKEREADEAFTEAKQAQIESVKAAEEAREAEAEAEDHKQALIQAREAERMAFAEADAAQRTADAYPDDPAAQEYAADAKAAALKSAENTAAVETQYESAKEKAESAKELSATKSQEAAEAQQFADRKNAETKSERIAIASDQQKNIQDAAEARKIETSYGLLYNEKTDSSTMIVINAATGKTLKESPVTDIRGTNIFPIEEGFIAIAGRNDRKNQAVKLVIIDTESMEIIAQSVESLSSDSALICYQGLYYGVIVDGKKCFIGCWSENLRLQAKSKTEVIEKAPLIITDKGVTVTTVEGKGALLKIDTLEEVN